MRKLVVTEWVSLDGIFDADTMDQWYAPYDSEERQKSIRDTIMESDSFLLGHVTFEMLAPYWSTQKNNEMGVAGRLNEGTKYVVTTNPLTAVWENTVVINGKLADEVARLKQQPGQNILVMGSADLVQSLTSTGLIDEYRLLVHPVIMGKGKRFFTRGMDMTQLKLAESRMLDKDVTFQRFEAVKSWR